jgi:multidrug ABC transporter, ATPase/permease protein
MLKFIQKNMDSKRSMFELFFLVLIETVMVILISSKIANLVNSIINKGNVLYHLAVFLIVIGVYLGTRYIKAMLNKRMVAEYEKNFYEDVTTRVANMTLLDIYKIGKGNIISLLMNENRQIKSYILLYLCDMVYQPCLFVWIFIYMCGIAPAFALIMTILMLSTIVISYFASKELSKINNQRNKENAKRLTIQKEVFSNVISLKMYRNEAFLSERNEEVSLDILKSSKKYIKRESINYFPSLINEYLPVAIAIVGGVILYRNGSLSFGEFVAVLQLFTTVSLPMSKYAGTIVETKNTIETVKRLEDTLHTVEEKKDIKSVGQIHKEGKYVYEIKELSFGYSKELVLKDISLTIAKNEHIGIIGRTGTGKSTLLNILLGAVSAYKGEVCFYGSDMKTLAQEDVWKHIAYIDQNRYLMSGTVAYNIFQDNVVETNDVEDILRRTNLNKDIDKLENGLDTVVATGGANLSGGQKEKITMGRALFKDADILVFDEPSSALDEESEQRLIDTIDMCKNKTVIIVTHRKDMLKKCDRIYKVDEGKIDEVTYDKVAENL